MRVQFVMQEILIGLRRNLTMTVAVVLTVAISLTLFGAGLLMSKQVDTMQNFWFNKVEVSIFLTRDVTDAQRESLRTDLQQAPLVEKVYYESKQQAYQHFKEYFKDSPDLVNNASPDALPESFRVKLTDPTKFDVISSEFSGQPGVDQVQDQRKLLEPFFKTLDTLRNIAWGVAAIQLLAGAILIGNTIRVAAFSRRRETSVMRLVGASNLYIQMPFLLEGALAGLVGAGISVPLLAALKHFVIDNRLKQNIKFVPWIDWGAVWSTLPLIFPLGVGLAALASFITLLRYLRT